MHKMSLVCNFSSPTVRCEVETGNSWKVLGQLVCLKKCGKAKTDIQNCFLTSVHALWHTCTHSYTQIMHIHRLKKKKNMEREHKPYQYTKRYENILNELFVFT